MIVGDRQILAVCGGRTVNGTMTDSALKLPSFAGIVSIADQLDVRSAIGRDSGVGAHRFADTVDRAPMTGHTDQVRAFALIR